MRGKNQIFFIQLLIFTIFICNTVATDPFEIPLLTCGICDVDPDSWHIVQTVEMNINEDHNSKFILDLSNPYLIAWNEELFQKEYKTSLIPESDVPGFEFEYFAPNGAMNLELNEYKIKDGELELLDAASTKNFDYIMCSDLPDQTISQNFPYTYGTYGLSAVAGEEKLSTMSLLTSKNDLEQIVSLHLLPFNAKNYNGSKMFVGGVLESYLAQGYTITYYDQDNLPTPEISAPYLPLVNVYVDEELISSEAENLFAYMDISDAGLYFPDNVNFPISTFNTITFEIENDLNNTGRNITFTKDQLTINDVTYVNKSSTTVYGNAGKNYWILGALPLSYYVLVIDYKNNEIRIAQSHQKKDLITPVWVIMGICILVLIFVLMVAGIIFYLREKKNSKLEIIEQDTTSQSNRKSFQVYEKPLIVEKDEDNIKDENQHG